MAKQTITEPMMLDGTGQDIVTGLGVIADKLNFTAGPVGPTGPQGLRCNRC